MWPYDGVATPTMQSSKNCAFFVDDGVEVSDTVFEMKTPRPALLAALALVNAANGSLRTKGTTAVAEKVALRKAVRAGLLACELDGVWDATYTFTPAGRAALEAAV
jgi:hypothetical protein